MRPVLPAPSDHVSVRDQNANTICLLNTPNLPLAVHDYRVSLDLQNGVRLLFRMRDRD